MATQTGAPFHVRIFTLDGSQYRMFNEGTPVDDAISLDEWLASELAGGYKLQAIVNVTPDGSKVRVMTQCQPEQIPLPPAAQGPIRPKQNPAHDPVSTPDEIDHHYRERMRRFNETPRRERRYVPFRQWRRDRFMCSAGEPGMINV